MSNVTGIQNLSGTIAEIADVPATAGGQSLSALGISGDAERPSVVTDSLIADLVEISESDSPAHGFEFIEELGEQEDYENLGRWVAWPAMKGASVLIAHLEGTFRKRERLEAEYRSASGLKPGDPLHKDPARAAEIDEDLFRRSMYGTSIKGWRGLRSRNGEFPFTQDNFKAMISRREFRKFVLRHAREFEDHRIARNEAITGNS